MPVYGLGPCTVFARCTHCKPLGHVDMGEYCVHPLIASLSLPLLPPLSLPLLQAQSIHHHRGCGTRGVLSFWVPITRQRRTHGRPRAFRGLAQRCAYIVCWDGRVGGKRSLAGLRWQLVGRSSLWSKVQQWREWI